MFTLLSWNILQGGGTRCMSILDFVGSTKPTICILSEFRNNESGFLLRNGLLKLGYRHQFVSQALPDDNSVLIASTLPCTNHIHPKSDTQFSNNILSVEFELFHVMGVYLPHKKKHILFDYIQNLIQNDNKPYIIAGDFNSGLNGIDQVGDSFWYEDKMKYFPLIGYIDAFRYLYPGVKEYSWYSHQGNGFRYDHIFLSELLSPLIRNCNYDHTVRQSRISDHSAMFLELR